MEKKNKIKKEIEVDIILTKQGEVDTFQDMVLCVFSKYSTKNNSNFVKGKLIYEV